MRRQTSPHDTKSPKGGVNINRARGAAGWERRSFCFIYSSILPQILRPVKRFFEKIQKNFLLSLLRQNLRQTSNPLTSFGNPRPLLSFFHYCVSFCTKFLTKNRSILTIYNFGKIVYNIYAVGGTNSTASRTTSYCNCEASILWGQCASFPQLCFF